MPWARAYHLAQSNLPYVLFTMSRTSAREDLFQWAGPTHASQTFLVTYDGSGIEQYDPKLQQEHRVIAIKSDVTEYALKELAYPEDKIDLIDSNATLIHMLLNRRADLFSISDSALMTLAKDPDADKYAVKVLALTRKSHGYFAFSKAIDPEVVEAFQAALDKIHSQQLLILEKYDMNY